MSLFAELKRRNVIRVGVAYSVASWLLIEISSVILPIYAAPDWVIKVLVALVAVGLPIALLFSWVYELTPEGVKKESEVDRSQSVTGDTGQRLDKITIAMLVVVAAIVIYSRILPSTTAPATAPETAVVPVAAPVEQPAPALVAVRDLSIAVLPFVNMSADPDNEYFSDGVSEEILNVLSRIPGLKVAARTSAFQFKGRNLDVSEIGRQLKVANVLEGSVRKSGNQVRITAQLIKVDDGFHLWSETYTRTLDDVFAIQDEIANAIVEALKVTLGTESAVDSKITADSIAYNHYLKGRFFWHQRTGEAFLSAERELLLATERDPLFARAWSALADVYVLQPEYGVAPVKVAIPKSRAAVAQALDLDPGLATAVTTRAYVRALYDWDPVGAESDFKQALALDPSYATAYQWYAEVLVAYRRLDEAETLARRAFELDPLAPVKPVVLANTLREMGRFDEAYAYYDLAMELAPDSYIGLGHKGMALS